MVPRWKSETLASLSSESLEALINNEIPVIALDDFATLEESHQMAAAVLSVKAKAYEFGRPGSYIGNPLTHYRNRPKQEYFAQVAAAEQERAAVIEQAFDPVVRFRDRVSQTTDFDISTAVEPGFGPYFAGIFRIIAGGSDLHVDFAPTFAKGSMVVGEISTQLAWNFYASSPSEGGETVVYNRPFEFSGIDKIYKPYDSAQLAGYQSFTFKPRVGSVVIFNTGNPHVVLPSADGAQGGRIATGSFIGALDRRKLILWS